MFHVYDVYFMFVSLAIGLNLPVSQPESGQVYWTCVLTYM